MGGRLSKPKGPAGTTESSVPTRPGPPPSPKHPFPRQINSRTIAAPLAAFTMACLLFVYARTSIRAAKENARRVREADTGGEGLSLLAEHRRRHGKGSEVEGTGGGTVVELSRQLMGRKKGEEGKDKKQDVGNSSSSSEEEDKLKMMMKKGRKSDSG